jgi:hypothetical protein
MVFQLKVDSPERAHRDAHPDDKYSVGQYDSRLQDCGMLYWVAPVVSGTEYNSEFVRHLDKFSLRRNYQGLNILNDPVFQRELGIPGMLTDEPFRDFLNRPV